MRANFVDRAGSPLADLAAKRGTATALAAHAGLIRRDECFGDAVDFGILLGRKAWPFGRIGAAGPAALAVEGRLGASLRRQDIAAGQSDRPRRKWILFGPYQRPEAPAEDDREEEH